MIKIAAVINFCTNDLRFLDRCICGIRSFSSQIIIPVCDHFYNGEKENLDLLERIYAKYPEIDFIQFAYSEKEVYGTPSRLVPGSPGWAQHWHNSARLIGNYFLQSEITHVLFLDVDEIFADSFAIEDYAAIRFATYWYFRTANTAATVYPDGPLLMERNQITTRILLNEDERAGMFQYTTGDKIREFMPSQKPIVHHYSWVRTKKELQKKVRTWGHHWERNWENLLKTQGDFVRGYEYQEVEVFWDPLDEAIQLPAIRKKPAYTVTPSDIARKELERIIRF